MCDEFDQIISLRGDDSRVLWALIEQIEAQLERDDSSQEHVIAILDDPNTCIDELSKYNPEKVSAVKNLLAAIFQEKQSIQLLVEMVKDYEDRFLAITLLGWYGENARDTIPAFIGVIGSGHPANGAAKRAIQLIGEAEEFVLSAIQQSILNEDDASFLELIDLALHTKLRASREFEDMFSLGAKSKNPKMRWAAAFWISELPESSKQRMEKVIEELRNDLDDDVREQARENK